MQRLRTWAALFGATAWALALAVAPPAAADSAAPEIRWAAGSDYLQKADLDSKNLVGLRLSGDGSRLFLVEQRFGQPNRMVVMDAATGKVVADLPLNEGVVSEFSPSADGSRVLLVGDYGAWMGILDVAGGTLRRTWEKEPGQGFRFTMPVSVNATPDGWRTRGYWLTPAGTDGDYLVNVAADGAVSRGLDLRSLVRRSGLEGLLTNLVVNADGTRAAWVVSTAPDKGALFVGSTRDTAKLQPVESGVGFASLAITAAGDRAFYSTVVEPMRGELKSVEVSTGETTSLGKGAFLPPMVSPDGKRLLVGRLAPNGLSQKLLASRAEDGWKLTPVYLADWNDEISLYTLAGDGHTFAVWTKDRIASGRL